MFVFRERLNRISFIRSYPTVRRTTNFDVSAPAAFTRYSSPPETTSKLLPASRITFRTRGRIGLTRIADHRIDFRKRGLDLLQLPQQK